MPFCSRFICRIKPSCSKADMAVLSFTQVLEVKDIFEAHLYELYSLHRRPEQQYSILLTDFWMCLDFNGFLGRSLQRKKCYTWHLNINKSRGFLGCFCPCSLFWPMEGFIIPPKFQKQRRSRSSIIKFSCITWRPNTCWKTSFLHLERNSYQVYLRLEFPHHFIVEATL